MRALGVLLAASLAMHAQQQVPIAFVPVSETNIAGDTSGTARLYANANVRALDRTAHVTLARGGAVDLCATSELHLLRSSGNDALQFALDRGALELRGIARPGDVLLTPDLRFALLTPGTFDLRVRVARDGDTCVENRGESAPVLQVSENFGDAVAHLAPGRHVLFEHGSLREVVDNEREPCGCPAATPIMTAARGSNATSAVVADQAAALHPFPAAQSAGLTDMPSTLVNKPASTADGADGAIVAELATNPAGAAATPAAVLATNTGSATGSTPAASASAPAVAPTAPPPAPPGAHDIAHSIGRFFKRLFHRKPAQPESANPPPPAPKS